MPIDCNTRLLWIPGRKKRCRVTLYGMSEKKRCLPLRFWQDVVMGAFVTWFECFLYVTDPEGWWNKYSLVRLFPISWKFGWCGQIKTLSNFTSIESVFWLDQVRKWAAKLSIYNKRNGKGSMKASEPLDFFWKRCTPLSTFETMKLHVLEFWKLWWTWNLKGKKKSYNLLDFCKFCGSWLAFAVRKIWNSVPHLWENDWWFSRHSSPQTWNKNSVCSLLTALGNDLPSW